MGQIKNIKLHIVTDIKAQNILKNCAIMSAELCWSIIRKNSCFLKKSHGLTLSKEPNNLTGLNSFKYNGLVNKKAVGVDAAVSGKGVVLAIRKSKGTRNPAKALSKTTLHGSRHAIKTIQNTLGAKWVSQRSDQKCCEESMCSHSKSKHIGGEKEQV